MAMMMYNGNISAKIPELINSGKKKVSTVKGKPEILADETK